MLFVDFAGGEGGSHIDNGWTCGIGEVLAWPGQGGEQQVVVAHSGCATVEGQDKIVGSESIRLVDPNRLDHFASSRRVLL